MKNAACRACRQAVSASLDAGTATAVSDATTTHLERCRDCRRWAEAARELSATVSPLPVPEVACTAQRVLGGASFSIPGPVDDLVNHSDIGLRAEPLHGLVDDSTRDGGSTTAATRAQVPRLGSRMSLALVAILQLAVTLTSTVLTGMAALRGDGPQALLAFQIALAVGLLWAARRPSLAQGMAALVGVAALAQLISTGLSLGGGAHVSWGMAPRLLVAVEWLLLRRVAVRADAATVHAIALEPCGCPQITQYQPRTPAMTTASVRFQRYRAAHVGAWALPVALVVALMGGVAGLHLSSSANHRPRTRPGDQGSVSRERQQSPGNVSGLE